MGKGGEDATNEDDAVTIALPSRAGNPSHITLTFDEASALGMRLPRILTEALRRKFSDENVRHIYPIDKYNIECVADFRRLLLNLSSDEGYDILFALDLKTIRSLIHDLERAAAFAESQRTPVSH